MISTALSPCLHSASTSKLKPITLVRCHARLCNRSRARSDRKCRRPPSQCEPQYKREYSAHSYLHLYTHLYTHLYVHLHPRPRCKPTALSRHLLRPHRYQALPATARAGRQPSDRRCSATADRLRLQRSSAGQWRVRWGRQSCCTYHACLALQIRTVLLTRLLRPVHRDLPVFCWLRHQPDGWLPRAVRDQHAPRASARHRVPRARARVEPSVRQCAGERTCRA